jgi:flavodoxin
MKTAVIYYSYTGNTHRVAQLIAGILREKGDDVIPIRIRPLKEEANFLIQCLQAFFTGKPELYRTLLDLKDFDRIFIGSPVWAFKPAPAINTFLDKCSSLEGKEAVAFVTFGTGIGVAGTLKFMEKGFETKGARSVKTISFRADEPTGRCREKVEKLL